MRKMFKILWKSKFSRQTPLWNMRKRIQKSLKLRLSRFLYTRIERTDGTAISWSGIYVIHLSFLHLKNSFYQKMSHRITVAVNIHLIFHKFVVIDFFLLPVLLAAVSHSFAFVIMSLLNNNSSSYNNKWRKKNWILRTSSLNKLFT